MDIIKSRSYMQKIKSKHRVSETLVIENKDFFELIGNMLATRDPSKKHPHQFEKSKIFTQEQIKEIESCVQLTPKKPNMFAIRHVESLFQVLMELIQNPEGPSQP